MIKPIKNIFNNHVVKCSKSDSKNVAYLMATSVGLDTYGSICDIINIRKNKEIPEDKRAYTEKLRVSGLFLSVAVQILSGLTILNKKVQEKMSNFLFGSFKKNTQLFNKCTKGLKTLSGLVLITTIIKRGVMPLISTPMASVLKRQDSKKTDNNIYSEYSTNFKNR